jgi:hypothetical protein
MLCVTAHPSPNGTSTEVAAPFLRVRLCPREEPAHVGVTQPTKLRQESLAEARRRMWVSRLVGIDVMPAVIGHPADHRAFDGHRAGDGQRDPKPPVSFETSMGEQAMKAERDAVPGDRIQGDGQNEIEPADAVVPEVLRGPGQCGKRGDHDERGDQSFGPLRGNSGVGSRNWRRCRFRGVHEGRGHEPDRAATGASRER